MSCRYLAYLGAFSAMTSLKAALDPARDGVVAVGVGVEVILDWMLWSLFGRVAIGLDWE